VVEKLTFEADINAPRNSRSHAHWWGIGSINRPALSIYARVTRSTAVPTPDFVTTFFTKFVKNAVFREYLVAKVVSIQTRLVVLITQSIMKSVEGGISTYQRLHEVELSHQSSPS